jgi:hypothetical protein
MDSEWAVATANLIAKLGPQDGVVTRDVLAGYLCYILLARAKFEKKIESGY